MNRSELIQQLTELVRKLRNEAQNLIIADAEYEHLLGKAEGLEIAIQVIISSMQSKKYYLKCP